MTIKYDLEKLRSIVKDIQTLLGISISISDYDKRIILQGNNNDKFCSRINSTPTGRAKCECSDYDLLCRCSETGAPVSHICHAGILDTVVPIVKQGVTVGYIFIGRIRPEEKPNNLAERLDWLGDSIEEIEKRYSELSYFNEDQLDAVVNLVSNIIFDSAVTVQYDDFIETATDYIEKNLDRDLCIGSLCQSLYVSKNRLYEAFRTQYGITVNEYVWQRRIVRAKELLKETGKSTAEISSEVGIENFTYFCRMFKRAVGLSPMSYRKANSGKRKIES